MPRPKKPKPIQKKSLRSLLKQGKKIEAIAKHYRVSESTVSRYIHKHKLSHLVKKGRRPLPKKPSKIKPKRIVKTWIPVKNYVHNLDTQYHFVNISYPSAIYVNQRTLVCSHQRRNPSGLFTTVGIYSIVYVSNVYFLFTISIRYSQQPIPFKEIYEWVSAAAPAILEEQYQGAYYVVKIVAYTFSKAIRKPKAVQYA